MYAYGQNQPLPTTNRTDSQKCDKAPVCITLRWRHMDAMASQITSQIVYSIVYPGADQRKHQSPASLAFVRGFHRWPVNCPHKGQVTRKMFPFDDVIMKCAVLYCITLSCTAQLWKPRINKVRTKKKRLSSFSCCVPVHAIIKYFREIQTIDMWW